VRPEPVDHEVHRLRGILRAPELIAQDANVLYTGPALAGVGHSIRYIVHQNAIPLGKRPRYRFERVTPTGVHVSVQSDSRSPYGIEGAELDEYLEFLERVQAVVFVADSQAERALANVERLQRLATCLTKAGRLSTEVPIVFQCNKRDTPTALPIEELARQLKWPRSEFIGSVATTGLGVPEALRVAIALATATASSPYR
jgi:hypothetical protein